jgi:hypothetical protein
MDSGTKITGGGSGHAAHLAHAGTVRNYDWSRPLLEEGGGEQTASRGGGGLGDRDAWARREGGRPLLEWPAVGEAGRAKENSRSGGGESGGGGGSG